MPTGIMPAPIVPPPVTTPLPDDGPPFPGTNPLSCLGGAQVTMPPIVMTIFNGGHWVTIVYNADGSGGQVVSVDGVCLSPILPVAGYPWTTPTSD